MNKAIKDALVLTSGLSGFVFVVSSAAAILLALVYLIVVCPNKIPYVLSVLSVVSILSVVVSFVFGSIE